MSKEDVNHSLIIRSLHDANAECACGNWHYSHPGPRTRGQVEAEHGAHLSNAMRALKSVCPACGSTKPAMRLRVAGDPLDFSCHDYWCDDEWHSSNN
jgi:hypothetical protein